MVSRLGIISGLPRLRNAAATRLLGVVVALAMLAAPLAMFGIGAGHAMPIADMQMTTPGHCSSHSGDVDTSQPCGSTQCLASCTTIAATNPSVDASFPHYADRIFDAPPRYRLGVSPGFDPPPPRDSARI